MNRLQNFLDRRDAVEIVEFLRDSRFTRIPSSAFFKDLSSPWNEIFANYSISKIAKADGVYLEAYEKYEIAFIKFTNYVKGDSTQWTVPLLRLFIFEFRQIAEMSRSEKSLNSCSRILMNSFGGLLDREPDFHRSKKQLLLLLVNNLFALYFKLNSKNLCGPLIKSLEQQHAQYFKMFPKAELVTYRYYAGVIALYESNFTQAREWLEFAFLHCHKGQQYWRNRRKILTRLIPVKLLYGLYPTDKLLGNYKLGIFSGISSAVKSGDIAQFEVEMNDYMGDFISKGIYLLMERIRINCNRNFVKRVFTITKSTRLKLDAIQVCLKRCDQSWSMEEVEAMLANLINLSFIAGYISHQHFTLVLSKTSPFPKIK